MKHFSSNPLHTESFIGFLHRNPEGFCDISNIGQAGACAILPLSWTRIETISLQNHLGFPGILIDAGHPSPCATETVGTESIRALFTALDHLLFEKVLQNLEKA